MWATAISMLEMSPMYNTYYQYKNKTGWLQRGQDASEATAKIIKKNAGWLYGLFLCKNDNNCESIHV